MGRILSFLPAACALILLISLPLSDIRASSEAGEDSRPQLTVGILDAPLMGFYDPQQQLQGFEAELAQMLCERLNYRCRFRLQSFQHNLQQIKTGQLDLALSNILVTEQRRTQMLFSQRYMRSGPGFIGDPKRQPTDRPARVAVLENSVHARYLQQQKSTRRQPVFYPDVADLYQALLKGEVDQVMAPSILQLSFLYQPGSEHLDMLEAPLDLPDVAGEIAVAIRADRPQLRAALNQALDQLLTDGSYDRLNKRYFPFNLY